MAYAVKYQVDFSNLSLRISKKDYTGSITAVEAGFPAVVHSWDRDEPLAPIKGSSLKVNIIGVPLTDFYSNADDEYLGELFFGSQLLFSGFLVQDDSGEDVDDLQHNVTLSFTDTIGLLKAVTLGTAFNNLPSTSHSAYVITLTTSGVNLTVALGFNVNDTFDLFNGATLLGSFIIASVTGPGTYTTTTVLPTLSGMYTISVPLPLPSKITLFTVIKACLIATGLSLPLDIYASLKEDSQVDTESFFEQTLIAKESFLKEEREYIDCYAVLEMIMQTFNCTIMQCQGRWNIIRWLETGSSVKCFHYDAAFLLTGTGNYSNTQIFGKDKNLYPEFGYNKKIQRPYNIVKETFNYNTPKQLIKNEDLKDLGILISTTTVSAQDPIYPVQTTLKDYALTGFTLFNPSYNPVIRVEYDTLTQAEIQRYIVAPNVAQRGFLSSKIESSAGDVFDLSASYSWESNSGSKYFLVLIRLEASNGTTYFLSSRSANITQPPFFWAPINTANHGLSVFEDGKEDLRLWKQFSLKSMNQNNIIKIPYDGLLTIVFYPSADSNGNVSGRMKDIHIDYSAYVNNSTLITGQTHTRTQDINIKNKDEGDIKIDDSPRNFIAGTLFLDSLNGLIQKRTAAWNTGKKLGEVTTQELKQWRSKPRTICEGNLYGDLLGALTGDKPITPLTTFTNPAFPLLNFIPGRMEIDYVENKVSGTFHEIRATGETDATTIYKFDYNYSNTK